MDITDLILIDHDRQRRGFALLDEAQGAKADNETVQASGTASLFFSMLTPMPRRSSSTRGCSSSARKAARRPRTPSATITTSATRSEPPAPIGWAARCGGRAWPTPAPPTATTWARRSAARWPTSVGVRRWTCGVSWGWSSPPTRRHAPAGTASTAQTRIRTPTSRRTAEPFGPCGRGLLGRKVRSDAGGAIQCCLDQRRPLTVVPADDGERPFGLVEKVHHVGHIEHAAFAQVGEDVVVGEAAASAGPTVAGRARSGRGSRGRTARGGWGAVAAG